MITDTLKKIEAARAKLASLEAAADADLKKELAALPAQYGFTIVKAFVKAVKAAAGSLAKGPEKKKASGRRTRTKITNATRAEVKKLTEAGRTGAQIAKAVGISLASVHNIKKALGLVKKRL